MNKKTRDLLRENNEYEKNNLSEQSQTVMTDIVCYLRCSKLSEYNQEIVRRDIDYMLADGEGRGETPETIIGSEYKEFCDAIIQTFPEMTLLEKVLRNTNELSGAVSVLALIWLFGKMLQAFLQKTSVYHMNITMGEILGGIILVVETKMIVNYILRGSFEQADQPEQPEHKRRQFILLWMKLTVLLCVPILLTVLLVSPSFPITLPVAIGIVVVPLVAGFVIDRMDS